MASKRAKKLPIVDSIIVDTTPSENPTYGYFPTKEESKYSGVRDHLHALIETLDRSEEILISNRSDLSVCVDKKHRIEVAKGKVDSELRELTKESQGYKTDIADLEKQEMSLDKSVKKLQSDLDSFSSMIVRDQPKREKLLRKQSKKLHKVIPLG